MAVFSTMFVPTLRALADGATPASWRLEADGPEQLTLRLTRLSGEHLGIREMRLGDGDHAATELWPHASACEPIGSISWVADPIAIDDGLRGETIAVQAA